MRYPKPNVCTSFNNCTGGKHCRECSHAVYKARFLIGKKAYWMTFAPLFGVLFTKRANAICNWTPNKRHPLWGAFNRWHEKKFGKKD
jgi:hypothetical protein